MSTFEHYFVEQTPDGRYAVRGKNSQRASGLYDRQRDAIDRARELNPTGRPDIECVRHTDRGGPDKWR